MTTPPGPLFADRALAVRIEAAATQHGLACARTLTERQPTRTETALPVAGGVATSMGRGGSLSQAIGLGMCGPVEEQDIVALEELYRGAGLPARICLCPHADAALFALLGARGYRLTGMESVLARSLALQEAAPDRGETMVRIAGPTEAALWVETVDAGFRGEGEEGDRALLDVFEALFFVPSSTYFLATLGTSVAGGGAVDLSGGVAFLFATSTRHGYRSRGVHTALLQARLAFARERGCDLAVIETAPGSASQRNAERQGFRVVYMRALLVKPA